MTIDRETERRSRQSVGILGTVMLALALPFVTDSRPAGAGREAGLEPVQGVRMTVDLSPEGWDALRGSRTGIPFMKIESLAGVLFENAWPSKIVVHAQYVRGGRVVRRGEKGVEVREGREFAAVTPLPLSEVVPREQLIASRQVVRAGEFLACATGKHLTFDRSMFADVDYRRHDALFVSAEPSDPKMRESAAVRPLLIYFPAPDGASKPPALF